MDDGIHEYTIREFRDEIESIYKSIKHPSYPQNDTLCKVIRGKECFEEIRISTGEKILLPVSYPYFFLFRGQNKEYSPCLPSLYRQDMDNVSLFIEKMRFYTFKQLLDTHPIVDGFFKARGYKIDYEGLAQHYGLKTHVLDFTSDIDVALFYATCHYNPTTDTYECINDKKIHKAILYLINPLFDSMTSAENIADFLENRISCIGLQPFSRPGVQKGFAYHCADRQNGLKATMYSIQYTANDSRKYFVKYKYGQKLWIKDELVPKAKAIRDLSQFTQNVFIECYNDSSLNMTASELEHELKQRSIFVREREAKIQFSPIKLLDISQRWDENISEQFFSSIVHRNLNINHNKYNSFSNQEILNMLTYDMVGSGFRFPHGGILKDYNP